MGKMVFDNYTALLACVLDRAELAMKNFVAPEVERLLQHSATNNAQGDWSRSAGGIADLSNMQSEVRRQGERIILCVKDTAIPQEPLWGNYNGADDTAYSRWIENGEWMDLKGYLESGGAQKPKRPARPFVKPVQEMLNQTPGIVTSALKKGL